MIMSAPSSPFFTLCQSPKGNPIHAKESSKGKEVSIKEGACGPVCVSVAVVGNIEDNCDAIERAAPSIHFCFSGWVINRPLAIILPFLKAGTWPTPLMLRVSG